MNLSLTDFENKGKIKERRRGDVEEQASRQSRVRVKVRNRGTQKVENTNQIDN